MNCQPWLDQMLEAEPEELRGRGESPLAGHIRSCEACRTRAALLVRSAELLDRSLAAEAASPPLPRRSRLHHYGAIRVVLPLAAAAVLALVFFAPDRRRMPIPAASVAEAPPAVPSVTPPPGHSAAVMQTGNPDIVIVWLY